MEDKLYREISDQITEFASDLMDKYFPKGECQERGKALVFHADLNLLVSKYVAELMKKKDLEVIKLREELEALALEFKEYRTDNCEME